MKVSARVLLLVGIAAFAAAAPASFVLSGMRFSGQALALTAGAALAAMLWLWVLASLGFVRNLSFGVGALVGFLSFLVVVVVFMAQPAPQYSVAWRAAFAGWVVIGCGLYPVLVGGALGHLLRKAPVTHAL